MASVVKDPFPKVRSEKKATQRRFLKITLFKSSAVLPKPIPNHYFHPPSSNVPLLCSVFIGKPGTFSTSDRLGCISTPSGDPCLRVFNVAFWASDILIFIIFIIHLPGVCVTEIEAYELKRSQSASVPNNAQKPVSMYQDHADSTPGAPQTETLELRTIAGAPFWEAAECFTRQEIDDALRTLDSYAGELDAGSPMRQAFTGVPLSPPTRWIYARMLQLAVTADREAGWGLLQENAAVAVDDIIFDRFGPAFSDVQFRWHCDAMPSDLRRRVSVVTYFTDPAKFEGGTLELRTEESHGAAVAPRDEAASTPGAEDAAPAGGIVSRRYYPGWAVAFPSKTLEHRVCPVTSGERRSLLLIVGAQDANGNATGPAKYF